MHNNRLKRIFSKHKKSHGSLLSSSERIARKALFRGGAEFLESIPLTFTQNVTFSAKLNKAFHLTD